RPEVAPDAQVEDTWKPKLVRAIEDEGGRVQHVVVGKATARSSVGEDQRRLWGDADEARRLVDTRPAVAGGNRGDMGAVPGGVVEWSAVLRDERVEVRRGVNSTIRVGGRSAAILCFQRR